MHATWFYQLFVTLILVLLPGRAMGNVSTDGGAEPTAPPNVVMFLIDDLGYYDLGCYGSTGYQTPRLDQLAKRSVKFTDFYSANPVCSPTRAAIMTGKAPQRLGITQWLNQPNDLHLPLAEVTLGEALAEAGYTNGYIGKWHLGEKDHQQPSAQGFPWMRCVNRAGSPGSYFFPFKRKRNPNRKGGIAYSDVPDLEYLKPGDYLTDGMTDHALNFIDENREGPFFLCFAHYAVHTPIQAPDPLVKKYKQQFDQLPPLDRPFFPERNGGKTRPRQDNPTYAAMVENLDTNVGRVIDHLRLRGLGENTIIVFTSDNGGLSTVGKIGPTSCRPMRAGKGWTYEGGIRIPTMIAWPGKLKPAECSTPGISMDLYPTVLDLLDLPSRPQQHLDGTSLVTAMQGKSASQLQDRFLAWTYPHHHGSKHSPSNAIRMGKWKLIQRTDEATAPADVWELYDLQADLGESNNLATRHPDRVEEMARHLAAWLEATPGPGDQ